jgi:hypothetical protein
MARNVKPATEDMFRAAHDAASRETVRAAARADLNLVGLAMRAEYAFLSNWSVKVGVPSFAVRQ